MKEDQGFYITRSKYRSLKCTVIFYKNDNADPENLGDFNDPDEAEECIRKHRESRGIFIDKGKPNIPLAKPFFQRTLTNS